MHRLSLLEAGLAHFDLEELAKMTEDVRPKLLIVADGEIRFEQGKAFGLWRFLYSLLNGSGVTDKPDITLAHRAQFSISSIQVGSDTLVLKSPFNFIAAETPVTLANYDQLWLFGYNDGDSGISPNEIKVIAEFMNSGGGVFAAGDHSTLGQGLCGKLPRIQHMRDWAKTPMGAEAKIEDAVKRIDTVVNPGVDNEFQFDDQSDNIPQRIYPNYTVKPLDSILRWQATVHKLLLLPGAPEVRLGDSGSSNFKLDIDVLPDHPHESVCFAVTADSLKNSTEKKELYPNEFPHSLLEPGKMVEAEIVAFGVSGGRSVFSAKERVWKPPVVPQMFGVISAYDGHDAKPYSDGALPPGRIVCDSSWHHYLNINLDGSESVCIDSNGSHQCSGLGSWSGSKPGEGTFTPSPDLEKIFTYYRNTYHWLQPAKKSLNILWWRLVAVRYHPTLIEELQEVPRLNKELRSGGATLATLSGFVGLGLEAARIISLTTSAGHLHDLTTRILLSDQSEGALELVKILRGDKAGQTCFDPDLLLYGFVGFALAYIVETLNKSDSGDALGVLWDKLERGLEELKEQAKPLLNLAFNQHYERASRTIELHEKMMGLLKLA